MKEGRKPEYQEKTPGDELVIKSILLFFSLFFFNPSINIYIKNPRGGILVAVNLNTSNTVMQSPRESHHLAICAIRESQSSAEVAR